MKSTSPIRIRKTSVKFAALAPLAATLLFLGAPSAHAAKKLLIVTDQPGAKASLLIKNKIMTMQPFASLSESEFKIEIKQLDRSSPKVECKPRVIKYNEAEIVSLVYWAKHNGITMSEADIQKYRKGYSIERLVECDKAAISRIGAQFQADQLLFVHNSPNEGGSGGDIPIILSGSIPGVGMHEWLHTFGLADEYPYENAQEATVYCMERHWVNVAIFNDQPPYRSSDDVRVRHRDQIPWLDAIPKNSKLVSGEKLGTPAPESIGIFPAQTCTKLKGVKSWKSTREETIMQNTYSNYFPKAYWAPILRELGISEKRIEKILAQR